MISPGPRCRNHGLEDLGRGSEQVDRTVFAVRQVEQGLEQVNARDPLRQRSAQDPAGPDDGLFVGQEQVALEE